MSEIWIADWTFYNKGLPVKVDAVVTKRLPLKLLMANHDTYNRAMKVVEARYGLIFMRGLDPGELGLKKFTIEYIRKIGT